MKPRAEAPLEATQRIVDAHHHLYQRPGQRYLLDELLVDLRSGHDVRATVFVQARSHYRTEGPESLRPVGETAFARAVAERCAERTRGRIDACAAIVGFADLWQLGDAVRPVLEAHLQAGGGRFRGVRQIAAWDADTALLNPAYPTSPDMLRSAAFRAGFAHLAPLGLRFDAWLLFHQLPDLVALARAFPDTPIVVNHCGGVVGVNRYAGRTDEVFARWSVALDALAACPNVWMKLGGLGMPLSGLGADTPLQQADSTTLARAWRPWMERCIEAFGTGRCMFESNFPADVVRCGYGTAWNALKRIASVASAMQKADLFWRSATRFYDLDLNEEMA